MSADANPRQGERRSPPIERVDMDRWSDAEELRERRMDDEPLGTCVVHGDYWTDDCTRCGR